MLDYYCALFGAAEINNSFYRLLSPNALARWRDGTPDSFVFTSKGSRFPTHMRRLKDVGQSLDRYLERTRMLGGKLKVIVFQLPPRWRCNLERLDAFLAALPPDYRYAFALRERQLV